MLRLWEEQSGLCHWCRLATIRPDQPGYFRSTGGLVARAATIDHVFSRLHPLRNLPGTGKQLVMACSKCNGRRSKVECEFVAKHGKLEPRIYRPDEKINELWTGVKRKPRPCSPTGHVYELGPKDPRRGVAHGICGCGAKSDWVVFVA